MKRLAFFMAALLIIPVMGWASPDTPGSATAVQIQPYENGFGNSTSFVSAMAARGYSITEARNDPGPTQPDFTLTNYISYLGGAYGFVWIEAHGNEDGHGVETYDLSDTGLQSRDNWYNFYVGHGVTDAQIYKGTSADGYSIGARAAGISGWFSSNSTAVVNKSCSSTGYTSSWNGSRAQIGFSGNSVSDETAFFQALEGGDTFTNAKDGLMILSGTGATILAPDVTSCSSDFGDLIPEGGLEVSWNFSGNCTGNISVSGPAYNCGGSWSNDNTTYTTTLCPIPNLAGQVWVTGNFTSGNGISTIHPTNSWGFFVGTNSAADVSFGVKNDTAIWRVGSEYLTAGYQVEVATDIKGDWQAIGPMHNPGYLEYQLDVSAAIAQGKTWFRLVEYEESGHQIIHGYTQEAHSGSPVRASSTPQTLEYYLQAIEDHQAKVPGEMGLPADIGDGYSMCIYTVAAFAQAIEDNYASFCRNRGYEVEVIIVPGYPQTAAEEDAQVSVLMSLIASKTASGVKYHEIWGRDCDYHYMHGERWPSYWTGPWATIHGQMENRYLSTANDVVIPSFTIRDNLPRGQNLSYWWPYFRSDHLYQPTGAVVTRVPVTEVWQVAAYSLIFQETLDFWSSYPSYGMAMGFYVGDLDHMSDGDGAMAAAAADTVRQRLLSDGHYLVEIYESEVPNPETRNMLLADAWNGHIGGGRTNLTFMYASQSGPHYPGNMYSKRELGDYVWRMDLLYPHLNHHPMFVAPTCGTSTAWASDDSWYYGCAVVIDMLFHEAGAIGYYGPSCGSLTTSNKEIGYVVADYIVSDFSRPVFESIALAEEDLLARFGGDPNILKQLWTMSKLGSSITRLGQVEYVTGVSDADIPQVHLAQNHPNPFNPVTKISFATKSKGQVRLKVFDVGGRLVKTLVDETLPAGPHQYSWNGHDEQGCQVASGIYFYQLEADGYSLAKKMTLLK